MSKTLVIYNYYKYNLNVEYFMGNAVTGHSQNPDGSSDEVDYAFVVNDPDENSKDFFARELYEKKLENVEFYHRENVGRDFGAYAYLLDKLKTENKLDKYDYFVFVNQTVIGPFFPIWYTEGKHWTKFFTEMINEEVKLSGTTINCHFMSNQAEMPHVQTMLFATDRVGLDVGFSEGIFDASNIAVEQFDIILNKEIGLSKAIIQNGYNISCLMPAFKGHDFRNGLPENSSNDPWAENAYYSTSLHPFDTIFFKANRRFGDKIINNLIKWQQN